MTDKMTAYDVHFMMYVNDLGIIPFCDSKEDFETALKSLSGKELRTVKRKFRKLWRTIEKKEAAKGDKNRQSLVTKNRKPKKRIATLRQRKVMDSIREKVQKKMNDRWK